MCFGGGGSPQVIQSSPIADDSKAKADAAQEAVAARKRRRALSLIATGGEGDRTSPLTAAPGLTAGKQTLGA